MIDERVPEIVLVKELTGLGHSAAAPDCSDVYRLSCLQYLQHLNRPRGGAKGSPVAIRSNEKTETVVAIYRMHCGFQCNCEKRITGLRKCGIDPTMHTYALLKWKATPFCPWKTASPLTLKLGDAVGAA
jgi:hypothetical protein